jgi:transcriptional regulator with XRE-family HTH domain
VGAFLWIDQNFNKAHIDMASELDITASSLGYKIRLLRQRLRRTLDKTATAAGLSTPFLSQIERGLANPSLRSLLGISRALGVPVNYFVDTPGEERSVCRADELKLFSFADSATLFGRLTDGSPNHQLDSMLVKIPPWNEQPQVSICAGEQFLYVLTGEVRLRLEDKLFILAAGDSAHFESTLPHSWGNAKGVEAVVVWVGTPHLL